MPLTFFAYITHKNTRADLYRIGNPYKKMGVTEDKAMVHDVEQFVVRALGWKKIVPQVVLLVGAVGPKFRHT